MPTQISGLSLAQKVLLAAEPRLTEEEVSSIKSPIKHVLMGVANANGLGLSERKILGIWKRVSLNPTADLDRASFVRMLNAIKGVDTTGHSDAEVQKMNTLVSKYERLANRLPDAETYHNSRYHDYAKLGIRAKEHHVVRALIHKKKAVDERFAKRGGPSDLRSTETMRRENKDLMHAAIEIASDAKSAPGGVVHDKDSHAALVAGQKKQIEPAAARAVRFNLPSESRTSERPMVEAKHPALANKESAMDAKKVSAEAVHSEDFHVALDAGQNERLSAILNGWEIPGTNVREGK